MVSVGTAIFHDPSACARILRELDEELVRRGIDRVADLVGRAHEVKTTAGARSRGTVP
jgi:dihydroorotate dehydrogenase (NAD+) catalytic subunit